MSKEGAFGRLFCVLLLLVCCSRVTRSLFQIALKHRKNKLGSQRIITFVGSPVDGPKDEDLRKLGAVLKKNNVSCYMFVCDR